MKYLIIEQSSIEKLVYKILTSNLKIMPDENTSKLIKSYLNNNENVSIEELIFIKLDSYGFEIIESELLDKIFFAESPNDNIAKIAYSTPDGWCHIHVSLINKIRNMFGDTEYKLQIKKIISDWVESKIPGWRVRDAEIEGLFDDRELDMHNDD